MADDEAFYETLQDWDFNEDVDFEMKIFDDTESRTTEITIHHLVAKHLQEKGFEDSSILLKVKILIAI